MDTPVNEIPPVNTPSADQVLAYIRKYYMDAPVDQIPTQADVPDEPANEGSESTIKGLSIRGLIALILIISICILSFLKVEIKEPLYTLASTVVAFYFGHQTAVRQETHKLRG